MMGVGQNCGGAWRGLGVFLGGGLSDSGGPRVGAGGEEVKLGMVWGGGSVSDVGVPVVPEILG